MWTAKRIVILIVGLLVCLSSFWTYALVLGVIDGLRALPLEYLPRAGGPIDDKPPPPPPADRMLKFAFGDGCKELQRPLRLWLPDKGIVFSAGNFTIDKDGKGQVHLAPFSAAIFHKSKVRGAFPEISTIQCDVAVVTCDKPVTHFGDLNNRKVVAVEMVGKHPGIALGNNRRTIEKHDDVVILITNGPLIYEERRNMIWTDGVVCLTDQQSRPPTVIYGTGMEMTLAKNNGPRGSKAKKPPTAAPSNDNGNIKKIKLRADVQMHFWVDAKRGFLGGAPGAKQPPRPADPTKDNQPKAPPAKAQIHIRTGGPFVYDLTKEFAWFESPPSHDGKPPVGARVPIAPDQILVERLQTMDGKKTRDQLVCDRLELQFRRKLGLQQDAANSAGVGGDKEIATATAFKRGNNYVTLALETDKMDAYAAELFYRAGDADHGPMTILKGEAELPLRAGKDGHRIKCQEMHLIAANSAGEGQRAWAKGPGQIDMLDTKNPEKESYPTHVLWRDQLDIVKIKEGAQVFDRMTVTGDASFIDELQKQELHGERIDVWVRQTRESEQKHVAVGGGKQELHRVIAQERVRAVSPEYRVRRSHVLIITFVPVLGRDERLPVALVANKPADEPRRKSSDAPPDPSHPDAKPTGQEARPPVQNAAEEKKPAAPIELEGDEITVVVATLGAKKELHELIAKGSVNVFQAGERQGEKRLDITGHLLTINYAERGHILVVHGEKKKHARLELGDTVILGPLVTVNQAINRAEVEGDGVMEMPTNKNLDGGAAAKKDARIRIYWKKNMTFDGLYAIYNGGVQAHEVDAYSMVQCQTLTAILDRTVSFKEGQKKSDNAKIDRIVLDKNVYIDHARVDERKQLVDRNILQGTSVFNYQDRPTRVTGPGAVRLLAKGNQSLQAGPKLDGPAPVENKQEWKLTHVVFRGPRSSMNAKNQANLKSATFYGDAGVEVFHFPTTDIAATMDADRPPKDALYLRCEILDVESKQSDGRTNQSMIAQRNVMFKTDQYLGYADILKFDDQTDTIILEGINGNTVRLFRLVNGEPRVTSVNSTKVLYHRKTGKLDTEGVKSITN